MFKIKEIFYTIQGEGRNTGRPAVFCRFVGCNLWSGREQDRASAQCRFCDTDFLGGFSCDEDTLVDKILSAWGDTGTMADCAQSKAGTNPLVVFTGGEPGLQLTESLLFRMRQANFNVAVETNGTVALPEGVYHITVSPKAGTTLVQTHGHELKVVWPQPFDLNELYAMDFRDRYLQPMGGVDGSVELTVRAVLNNPGWKLSLQTHKIIGVR
jgi:7-carboxy-7-deazaguanine synthase (Cx14CxxC type)